jgi:hypothetical protein
MEGFIGSSSAKRELRHSRMDFELRLIAGVVRIGGNKILCPL